MKKDKRRFSVRKLRTREGDEQRAIDAAFKIGAPDEHGNFVFKNPMLCEQCDQIVREIKEGEKFIVTSSLKLICPRCFAMYVPEEEIGH